MALPLRYNFRSLLRRKTRAVMAALGIGLYLCLCSCSRCRQV